MREVVNKCIEVVAEIRRTIRRRSGDHEGSMSVGLKTATLRRLSTILDAKTLINHMQEAIDIAKLGQHDKKESPMAKWQADGRRGNSKEASPVRNATAITCVTVRNHDVQSRVDRY